MSKYESLTELLNGRDGDEWRVGFDELESLLGFPLPPIARSEKSWWSNAGADKAHKRAWREHGWETVDLDLRYGFVTFRRAAPEKDEIARAVDEMEPDVGETTSPATPEARAFAASGETFAAEEDSGASGGSRLRRTARKAALPVAIAAGVVAVATGVAMAARGAMRR